MQYSSATILLHRPLADFGNSSGHSTSAFKVSRDICINHACLIAQYIHHYQDNHGTVLSMSWIALHMIATATTTLIASLSEAEAFPGTERQLSCLQTCMKALSELEKSHVPTRRVRKVVQQAMRILDLDARVAEAAPLQGSNEVPVSEAPPEEFQVEASIWDLGQEGFIPMTDSSNMNDLGQTWDFLDQFLPAGSQTDMLQSFENFLQW